MLRKVCSFVSTRAINPFLEFQHIQVGVGFTDFNIQGGITIKVHSYIRIGAGIGITERWNFYEYPLIPIFARGQFEGSLGSLNPFFSFDVGYEINTDDTSFGAILVNPMVGLKFNATSQERRTIAKINGFFKGLQYTPKKRVIYSI